MKITPLRAIRKKCLWCCNRIKKEVEFWPTTYCEIYPFRMGKGRPKVKIIRKFCLGCSETRKEIENCWDTKCYLYPYRMGKNPARKGMNPRKILKGQKIGV